MERRALVHAALAGLAYFGIVFVAGFALGTMRVLLLIPRLGEIFSVLLELPIILAVSWVACRRVVMRFDVPPELPARFVMGWLAFAVLMSAEVGLSVLGFGRTLPAHLDQYRQLPALIGLAGQMAFAMFPILQQTNRAR